MTVHDIPKPATPITDPRKLASVLAEVVTHYPHLMARTGPGSAEDANGRACSVRSVEARRFCATGIIRRALYAGAATQSAADTLMDMLHGLTGLSSLGTWWEESDEEPTPADYAALLRQVAAE